MTDLFSDLIGQEVLIRSADSGVHLGVLTGVSPDGTAVRLKDSRRLWRWCTPNSGAAGISLSEIALYGIDQKKSRITAPLPTIAVMSTCEIIPASGLCVATVRGADVAQPE
jgi:hypothetical protein